MSFNASQRTHIVGVTQLHVGLSATIEVIAPARVNGYQFKYGSGGSLAIVEGASSISSAGYLMSTTEIQVIDGPAKFYLAAAGATCVVHMLFSKSDSGV
jgi:hypothetical protein